MINEESMNKETKQQNDRELVQIDGDLWDEIAETCKHLGAKYTPEQKILAVQAYYAIGTASQASVELGLPPSTIRTWKQQSWWEPVRDAIVKFKNDRISTLLFDTSLSIVEKISDRVENGEPVTDPCGLPVFDDDGKPVTRPLTMKELSSDFAIMYDRASKANILNKDPTGKITVQQVMDNLKDTFLQMVEDERRVKTIEAEVYEGKEVQ